MKPFKVAVSWITGILIWTFMLSIALAWYDFGYLDMKTVAAMGIKLLPLLAVALGLLAWAVRQEKASRDSLGASQASPDVMPASRPASHKASELADPHRSFRTGKPVATTRTAV